MHDNYINTTSTTKNTCVNEQGTTSKVKKNGEAIGKSNEYISCNINTRPKNNKSTTLSQQEDVEDVLTEGSRQSDFANTTTNAASSAQITTSTSKFIGDYECMSSPDSLSTCSSNRSSLRSFVENSQRSNSPSFYTGNRFSFGEEGTSRCGKLNSPTRPDLTIASIINNAAQRDLYENVKHVCVATRGMKDEDEAEIKPPLLPRKQQPKAVVKSPVTDMILPYKVVDLEELQRSLDEENEGEIDPYYIHTGSDDERVYSECADETRNAQKPSLPPKRQSLNNNNNNVNTEENNNSSSGKQKPRPLPRQTVVYKKIGEEGRSKTTDDDILTNYRSNSDFEGRLSRQQSLPANRVVHSRRQTSSPNTRRPQRSAPPPPPPPPQFDKSSRPLSEMLPPHNQPWQDGRPMAFTRANTLSYTNNQSSSDKETAFNRFSVQVPLTSETIIGEKGTAKSSNYKSNMLLSKGKAFKKALTNLKKPKSSKKELIIGPPTDFTNILQPRSTAADYSGNKGRKTASVEDQGEPGAKTTPSEADTTTSESDTTMSEVGSTDSENLANVSECSTTITEMATKRSGMTPEDSVAIASRSEVVSEDITTMSRGCSEHAPELTDAKRQLGSKGTDVPEAGTVLGGGESSQDVYHNFPISEHGTENPDVDLSPKKPARSFTSPEFMTHDGYLLPSKTRWAMKTDDSPPELGPLPDTPPTSSPESPDVPSNMGGGGGGGGDKSRAKTLPRAAGRSKPEIPKRPNLLKPRPLKKPQVLETKPEPALTQRPEDVPQPTLPTKNAVTTRPRSCDTRDVAVPRDAFISDLHLTVLKDILHRWQHSLRRPNISLDGACWEDFEVTTLVEGSWPKVSEVHGTVLQPVRLKSPTTQTKDCCFIAKIKHGRTRSAREFYDQDYSVCSLVETHEHVSRVLAYFRAEIEPRQLGMGGDATPEHTTISITDHVPSATCEEFIRQSRADGDSFERTVALLVLQCLLGLEHLHTAGYTHGDLTPGALYLVQHARDYQLLLGNLGASLPLPKVAHSTDGSANGVRQDLTAVSELITTMIGDHGGALATGLLRAAERLRRASVSARHVIAYLRSLLWGPHRDEVGIELLSDGCLATWLQRQRAEFIARLAMEEALSRTVSSPAKQRFTIEDLLLCHYLSSTDSEQLSRTAQRWLFQK